MELVERAGKELERAIETLADHLEAGIDTLSRRAERLEQNLSEEQAARIHLGDVVQAQEIQLHEHVTAAIAAHAANCPPKEPA